MEDLSRVWFIHCKLIPIFICVTAGVYLLSNGLGLSCQGVLLLYSVLLLLIRFETDVLLFTCPEIYSASLISFRVEVILQQFEIFLA